MSRAPSEERDVKLIYLAGMGRSGSTILESVLGEYDGCVPVGEACFLWDRGVVNNTLCSCERWFAECPFWSEVMSVVHRDIGHPVDGAPGWFARYGSNRGLPRLLGTLATGRMPRELERYLAVLEALYRAIGAVSGARIIIDSSKFPGYGLLLDRLSGFEVHPVHLVRDSRAVSNSCRRDKVYLECGDRVERMRKHSLGGSAFRWYLYNLATELCGRFSSRRPMRVRYESFVERPAEIAEEIRRFAGEDHDGERVVEDRSIELHERHMVSGNPSRFLVGRQEIRRDDRWRHQLGAGRGFAVTALTYPLLRRYGYGGRLDLERRPA